MSNNVQARLGDPSQTLYLVDISSFIFRAYFGIRTGLKSRSGEPTNAVYGVAQMMARLMDDAKPAYIAITYDSPEPSFRSEIFPEYKANRSEPPEDLIPQFARIEQLIKAFHMPSYRQAGVEADDLIATLTRSWCKASPNHQVVIVSSDKDLMQLVGDRVRIWDTMADKVYGPTEVEEKFGVKPEQIRDYLALVGDASDNIPGVPGVGPKTAAELLKQWGTLDEVLNAAKDGKVAGKRGETIKTHEDDARISAELATVHEALKLEIDPDRVGYRFKVSDELISLFKELDFMTLVNRWSGGHADEIKGEASRITAVSQPGVGPDTFRTINTEKDFHELLRQLEAKKEFGFDLETTSLNPREAELVGFAVCHDPAFGCYIPVGHRMGEQLPLEQVIRGLRPFLEDPRYKKVGQNLKYDWSVLLYHGIKADGIGADTMVAAYVLDPEGRHNLQTLAAHYLDYTVMTYEQVCGSGKEQIGFDLVPIEAATRYSAEDAWIALRLWHALKPRLEQEKLMEVFATIDLPLVPVLMKMETQGVCIDVDWLKKLSEEFSRDLLAIEQRIQAYSKGPINLNSTKQLAQLLFVELGLPVQSKTKTGFSTDAKVLEALAPMHEVPRMLLEYREISKLKGTYVDPLPQLRDLKSGKIHASFHQTVAATGRLSSSDPNLQNIPIRSERGLRIRRAFVPSEGNVLVAADYSQIELRLLAHMSGDPELIHSFRNDEDVHRRTAGEIFGVPPEKVDDRQRGIAKAINFGLMYGKTAFGLAQELKISRREAQDTIDRYFRRYHHVKRYLDGLILFAKEKGYVTTLSGRKRPLPDILSRNAAVRANAERMAMNSPIQGTAADLMKLAIIELDHRLSGGKYEAKLIIQVHDEVVLDCPASEVAAVQKLVVEVMENAMHLDVPLRVNAASGPSWYDL